MERWIKHFKWNTVNVACLNAYGSSVHRQKPRGTENRMLGRDHLLKVTLHDPALTIKVLHQTGEKRGALLDRQNFISNTRESVDERNMTRLISGKDSYLHRFIS